MIVQHCVCGLIRVNDDDKAGQIAHCSCGRYFTIAPPLKSEITSPPAHPAAPHHESKEPRPAVLKADKANQAKRFPYAVAVFLMLGALLLSYWAGVRATQTRASVPAPAVAPATPPTIPAFAISHEPQASLPRPEAAVRQPRPNRFERARGIVPRAHRAASVPTARQAVATAVPAVATVLPVAPVLPRLFRRGDNGADLTLPKDEPGLGNLTVLNGTTQDAVVKLVAVGDESRAVRFVYVRAHNQICLDQIGQGEYRLLFKAGEDWDAEQGTFTRNVSVKKFDDPMQFRETQTRREVENGWEIHKQADSMTITLHAVVGGNRHAEECDPQDFDRAR